MHPTSQRIASFQGAPVCGRYVIVYEADLDGVAAVVIPSPNWLGMALAGGILPPVEAYHSGCASTVEAVPPIGPLSEEEAMEYLLQKDVPRAVWDAPLGNRRRFAIAPRGVLPASRQWRQAWRLALSETEE